MLRSLKQLYANKPWATRGTIGHIKDFHFEDGNWAIPYVVADTTSSLLIEEAVQNNPG
ncbi:MAG: hypothetical protein ACLQVY_08995 [Limisphaerales bacterium]